MRADTENGWYTLEDFTSYPIAKKEEIEINKVPSAQRSTEAQLLIYPTNKKIKAFLAQDYTEREIGNIEMLDSYDDVIEDERNREAEKKSVENQLELWDLSIEAERRLLVDTPFHCIGINAIKKSSVDLKIDEYVVSDDKEIVQTAIREALNSDSMECNDDGSFDMTYDKLLKVLANSDLQLNVIEKCEIDLWCDKKWMAQDFKNNHDGDYRVKFEYDGYSEATFKLIKIKDTSQIDSFKEDIDASMNLRFKGRRFNPEEMTCYGIVLQTYRKETVNERTKRLDLLNNKEMTIGASGSRIIGTLLRGGSNYYQLRIKFPDGKDGEKVKELIESLRDKNDIVDVAIVPNFVKEREILRREKSAVKMVKLGEGLKNEHLKDFIFNSAKAAPTKQFEHTDITQTEEYKECTQTHLLPLNSSQ